MPLPRLVFNAEGKCLEQPAEPWDSTFKDRVTTKAYPVQALGGLVFAYLGPQPAPLLPRYDLYVWDNVIRQVGMTLIPCPAYELRRRLRPQRPVAGPGHSALPRG